MKIGIYISGLGQSVVKESVEKYAERLMNEMSSETVGVEYTLKTEKISYAHERESTVVSINETGEEDRTVYKLYEFQYQKLLTERFNQFPILVKNFWLLLLVIRKFPVIVLRLFAWDNYTRPFQTFYVFGIFLVIAFAVLLMLPATLGVISGDAFQTTLKTARDSVGLAGFDIPWISIEWLESLSKALVSVTAILLLILPNANILITNLATEFVCANDYLERGSQRQLIQGSLDRLVDYISEHEPPCKIHFHAYSFGSIVAIDHIFPFGKEVTRNTKTFCEALITIGTPFEFVKAYYPRFYRNRKMNMAAHITWINIYSIADALATNFRKDGAVGDPEFGIDASSIMPVNRNYEVIPVSKGVMAFLMLSSLKAHGMYWDPKTEGQSCLGIVLEELMNNNLIQVSPSHLELQV